MPSPSLRARLALIGLTLGAVLLALVVAGHGLASAAPASPPAGVQLRPVAAAQNGFLGKTITYTLRVTNTSAVFDIITMTVTGNSWETEFFIVPGTFIVPYTVIEVGLNSGEGRNVAVQVEIPINAVGHDFATIGARSSNDPAVAASSLLNTSVRQLFLPITRK
jgi:hypothetical protein